MPAWWVGELVEVVYRTSSLAMCSSLAWGGIRTGEMLFLENIGHGDELTESWPGLGPLLAPVTSSTPPRSRGAEAERRLPMERCVPEKA